MNFFKVEIVYIFSILVVLSVFMVSLIDTVALGNSGALSFDVGFIISVLIVLSFILLLWCIRCRIYIVFLIVQLPLLILSSISYFKYAVRAEHLKLSDIYYAFNILTVVGSENVVITAHMLRSYIIFTVMAGVLTRWGIQHIRVKQRLLCFVLTGICLIFAIVVEGFESNSNSFLVNFIGNTFHNYKNPPIVTAFKDFESVAIQNNMGVEDTVATDRPQLQPGYNKEYLQAKFSELKLGSPQGISTLEIKPNVIVILSESFWDLSSIGVELSEEAIPNFKKLASISISGNLLSSTFGGGTADVEFELLTGFISDFIDTDLSIYESALEKPTMSAASIFKDLGYQTVALHTNTGKFYNRNNALRLLGFDKFISSDDLITPPLFGEYITDSVITDLIIEQYEQKTAPLFTLAITMQNHQVYNTDRFEEIDIKILDDKMPKNLKTTAEIYLHGLHESDKELQCLVDYFSTQLEPTVILFFGDHQPSIGADFGLHRYAGTLTELSVQRSPEQFRNLVKTPFLIWSNYKEDSLYLENIGVNFLMSYLFDYIEQPKPMFYHFIDQVYKSSHYFSRSELYIDNGENLYSEILDEDLELINLYKLFQYDMFLGDGYIKEQLSTLVK